MRGLNKAYLIGHIGHDPEIRATPNGTQVLKLSLATNHARKVGDEWIEQPDWHRITFFNKEAEYVARAAHKGDVLAVECTLKPRKWTDKQNVVHYGVDLVVDKILWLNTSRRLAAMQAAAGAEEARPVEALSAGDAGEGVAEEEAPF